MNRSITTMFFALVAMLAASGQESTPRATGSVWLEAFANRQGVLVAPYYAWAIETPAGRASGLGFAESAPHEELFSNHLVAWSFAGAEWIAIHAEMGGNPAHQKGFVQVGARASLGKVIPAVAKAGSLSVAFLPGNATVVGTRPSNLLVMGATKEVHLTSKISVSAEGFARFFAASWGGHVVLPVSTNWRPLRHLTPAGCVTFGSSGTAFLAGVVIK